MLIILILILILAVSILINIWLYKSIANYIDAIEIKESVIDKMIKDINAVKGVCFEHYNKTKDEYFKNEITKLIGKP